VEIGGWDQVRGRSLRSAEESAATRLRGILPADLAIHRVSRAPEGFDARFSAMRRRYLYRICDDPASLDPLRRYDTVLVPRRLDVESMDRAARSLLGLHDWAAFCKRRAGATTVRTLLDHRWDRAPDGTVEATVVADAFCHSMVRSLVGAVVPVGEGRLSVDVPREVLLGGVRDSRVRVMPPHGLSLEEVTYPPDDELAARAAESRVRRVLPG
jgi:tRNA pseudouridine38-40 synthase